MKIGFVLDDTLDKPDGVQQYVLMVGGWLSSQGHEVHYLVTDTSRTDVPNVHSLGGYLSGRFNGNHVRTPLPVSRKRIADLIARLNLDIIHLQMPYSPLFGGRVVLAAGTTPIVATFHILPYTGWQRLTNIGLGWMQRRSAHHLQQVIAPTSAASDFASRAYNVSSVTIPHPIDIAHFRAGHRLVEFDDNRLNVLFLGRLVARKGALTLIHAYLTLGKEARNRSRLVIVGQGPQLDEAKRLAGAATDITFTGFIEEAAKPDYLATADIAVFPATGGESFGIVLTEAMAARSGVVLGGNNPGYAGVLAPMPECLFDAHDQSKLTERLEELITDNDQRTRLHVRQQEYVRTFDLDTYGKKLLDIYAKAHTHA